MPVAFISLLREHCYIGRFVPVFVWIGSHLCRLQQACVLYSKPYVCTLSAQICVFVYLFCVFCFVDCTWKIFTFVTNSVLYGLVVFILGIMLLILCLCSIIITARSRPRLQNLTVLVVKKFSIFYVIIKFIAVFTEARYWTIFWAKNFILVFFLYDIF
jgi:hypothetical protein